MGIVLTPQNLSLVFIFITVWLLLLSFFLFRAISHYNRLTYKTHKKNLKEILNQLLEEIKLSGKKIGELFKRLDAIEKEGTFHVQKVGLLRFNPFADTGGEQSFILALLDGDDNGVVLTSLHSRSGTRWYAKELRKGKGVDFELSREEKKVIRKARKIDKEK